MAADFHVVVERDAEGLYVASVPQLPGCHTQAPTREELTKRIQEAIELWLEVEGPPAEPLVSGDTMARTRLLAPTAGPD